MGGWVWVWVVTGILWLADLFWLCLMVGVGLVWVCLVLVGDVSVILRVCGLA